jgi:hypothetical protein
MPFLFGRLARANVRITAQEIRISEISWPVAANLMARSRRSFAR